MLAPRRRAGRRQCRSDCAAARTAARHPRVCYPCPCHDATDPVDGFRDFRDQPSALTDSATRVASCRAVSSSAASTMTRIICSVPEGRNRIRPVSPSSASASRDRAPHRRRLGDRGLVGDLDVDQHLRQRLHRRGQLGQRQAGLRHPRHQPQPGDDAVAGGAQRGHHDVAGLLAAQAVARRPAAPPARSGHRRRWCARRCRPRAWPGAARGCSSRWPPACPRPVRRPPASPAPARP